MDESRVNLGAGAPGGAGDFSFEVGGYEPLQMHFEKLAVLD